MEVARAEPDGRVLPIFGCRGASWLPKIDLSCRNQKKTAPAPGFGVNLRHLALNAVGPCGSVISIDGFPATIEPITLAHTSAIGHTSARVAGKRSVWNQSRRRKRRRHLGEHLVQGQVRIGARRAPPTILCSGVRVEIRRISSSRPGLQSHSLQISAWIRVHPGIGRASRCPRLVGDHVNRGAVAGSVLRRPDRLLPFVFNFGVVVDDNVVPAELVKVFVAFAAPSVRRTIAFNDPGASFCAAISADCAA